MTPGQDELHRDLTDISHSAGVDDGVQLAHERRNQIAILNTVASHPGTPFRTAMAMELEHLLRGHVVLGEGPLHMLHLLRRELREQSAVASDLEALGRDIPDLELLAIVDRIVRVTD